MAVRFSIGSQANSPIVRIITQNMGGGTASCRGTMLCISLNS